MQNSRSRGVVSIGNDRDPKNSAAVGIERYGRTQSLIRHSGALARVERCGSVGSVQSAFDGPAIGSSLEESPAALRQGARPVTYGKREIKSSKAQSDRFVSALTE
jgi:hypothetical protein